MGGSAAGSAHHRVDPVDDPAHPHLLAHVLAEHERRQRVRVLARTRTAARVRTAATRSRRAPRAQGSGAGRRPRSASSAARTASPRPVAMSCERSASTSSRSSSARGSVVGVTEVAEPLEHLLEHRVHVAPAGERIGIGLEALGLKLAVDEPLDRAVGVRLERARRQDPAVADVRERRLRQRSDRRRDLAGERRRRGRAGAGELAGGGRLRRRPHDVGEHPAPAALGPVLDQQLGHVGEERRGQREVALLVRAPVAEDDALGRPGHARVEQVALAAERVLARAQPQAAAHRELAAKLVREERLGRGGQRELALAEAAHEHGAKAPGPDRERIGDEHRTGPGRRAAGDLEGLEQLDQLGAGRPLPAEIVELGQRPRERPDRAGVELLVGVEHGRAACGAARPAAAGRLRAAPPRDPRRRAARRSRAARSRRAPGPRPPSAGPRGGLARPGGRRHRRRSSSPGARRYSSRSPAVACPSSSSAHRASASSAWPSAVRCRAVRRSVATAIP